MSQPVRVSVVLSALVAVLACAGQTQSRSPTPGAGALPDSTPPTATAASATTSADTSWIQSDSAAHTATLSLVVTKPAGNPSALINGHRSGELQIVVPLHWTVKWAWRNDDPGGTHSLVVMTQREKVPLEGGRAAFSNAMSRAVTAGLATGQTDQTTFEAEEAGWYWLMCGVPNHALNGEWLELRVSPEDHAASVQFKQR
jgi:hypothetical protein